MSLWAIVIKDDEAGFDWCEPIEAEDAVSALATVLGAKDPAYDGGRLEAGQKRTLMLRDHPMRSRLIEAQ